ASELGRADDDAPRKYIDDEGDGHEAGPGGHAGQVGYVRQVDRQSWFGGVAETSTREGRSGPGRPARGVGTSGTNPAIRAPATCDCPRSFAPGQRPWMRGAGAQAGFTRRDRG